MLRHSRTYSLHDICVVCKLGTHATSTSQDVSVLLSLSAIKVLIHIHWRLRLLKFLLSVNLLLMLLVSVVIMIWILRRVSFEWWVILRLFQKYRISTYCCCCGTIHRLPILTKYHQLMLTVRLEFLWINIDYLTSRSCPWKCWPGWYPWLRQRWC
jgi:hypothetical protein